MSIHSEKTHPSLAGDQRSSGPRSALLAAIEKLLCLTTGLAPASARRDLLAARARVDEDRFSLVVLGEFKRGQSTLINALLGRELLPTGVVPLTSVITAIGAGARDGLVVHYTDGRELANRVAQAAREYRRDLTATVNEAANAIRAAVDRATESRQFGEQRSDARLHELAQIERQCEHMARTMGRWARDLQPPDETELR